MTASTRGRLALAGTVAGLGAVFCFVLLQSVRYGFHHDEHQFIAPGALLASHGLLPYRDYPYFHMPNVAFFYGALDCVFPYRVLPARVLCAVSAFGTLLLLLRLGKVELVKFPPLARCAILGATAILFTGASLFEQGVGFAWNHTIPVFFVIASFCLQLAAARRERARWLIFASGLGIGLAAGTRISFAPLAAPFLLSIFLLPRFARREKIVSVVVLSCGMFVALLPSFYLLARYPDQFLFGNFRYPKLATVWREYPFDADKIGTMVDPELGLKKTIKVPPPRPFIEKFQDFARRTVPRNIPAFAVFLLIGLPFAVPDSLCAAAA